MEYVTTARLTLPVVIAFTALLWLAGGLLAPVPTESIHLGRLFPEWQTSGWLSRLISVACVSLCTFQLWLLHNTFSLIRTRTNFYLSLFILLTGCLAPHEMSVGFIVLPLLLCSLHNLYRTYQQYQPVGYVFQSFLCLGLGSLFHSSLLVYIPLWYMGMLFFRSLTRRTFFAGLVGGVLPYWFLFAYAYWQGNLSLFTAPFKEFFPVSLFHYGNWQPEQILSLGYILFLSIAGSLHCIIHNYEDKIKTRSLLVHFIAMQVWTALCLFIQPQQIAILFPILIMGCSIPSGHLFALNRTKAGNIFFLLCVIGFIALITYRLWIC